MPDTKTSDPDIQRKWSRNREQFAEAEARMLKELRREVKENREKISREFLESLNEEKRSFSPELARYRLRSDGFS